MYKTRNKRLHLLVAKILSLHHMRSISRLKKYCILKKKIKGAYYLNVFYYQAIV